MIKTVTLNPAIDKTIKLSHFITNSVNIVDEIRLDAGGKGINVSKVLKELGVETVASGIIGRNNGEFIRSYLKDLLIPYDFLEVDGDTRTNSKIIDMSTATTTDINEKGLVLTDSDFIHFQEKLFAGDNPSVMVFSGTIPIGFPADTYKTLITKAKEHHILTILDAGKEAFAEGVKAIPNIVKPNINEFKQYFQAEMNSLEEIKEYAHKLIDIGIQLVAVSLGNEGALFVHTEKTIFVDPVKVKVSSTVSAGDSMVAILAMYMENKWDLERAASLAVATSAAAVATFGTMAPKQELIYSILKDIVFRYI